MNNILAIFFATIFSILLTIITFPLGNYSPDWILLIIIYWIIAIPTMYNFVLIWFIGILTDVTLGLILGMSALSYVVLAFLIKKNYKSLRYFTIMQQSLIIFLIMLLKITMIIFIDNLAETNLFETSLYWSSLSSAIVWPIIFYTLRHIRRKYNIV